MGKVSECKKKIIHTAEDLFKQPKLLGHIVCTICKSVCARSAVKCHNCGAKLDLSNIQTGITSPSKPNDGGDHREVIKPGRIASAQVSSEQNNKPIKPNEGRFFSDEDVDFVPPDQIEQINDSAEALGL